MAMADMSQLRQALREQLASFQFGLLNPLESEIEHLINGILMEFRKSPDWAQNLESLVQDQRLLAAQNFMKNMNKVPEPVPRPSSSLSQPIPRPPSSAASQSTQRPPSASSSSKYKEPETIRSIEYSVSYKQYRAGFINSVDKQKSMIDKEKATLYLYGNWPVLVSKFFNVLSGNYGTFPQALTVLDNLQIKTLTPKLIIMPNPLWVSKDGPEALSKELFTYARRLTEKDTFVVYVMAIPIAEAATANPTYGRKLIEFNEICKKKFGPQQFLDTTSFLPGNLTTDYSAPNNVTDEVLACAINRAVKCMLDKFVKNGVETVDKSKIQKSGSSSTVTSNALSTSTKTSTKTEKVRSMKYQVDFIPFKNKNVPSASSVAAVIKGEKWTVLLTGRWPLLVDKRFNIIGINYGTVAELISVMKNIGIENRTPHLVIAPNNDWFSGNKESPKQGVDRLYTFFREMEEYGFCFQIHILTFVIDESAVTSPVCKQLLQFNKLLIKQFKSIPEAVVDSSQFLPLKVNDAEWHNQYPQQPHVLNDDLVAWTLKQSLEYLLETERRSNKSLSSSARQSMTSLLPTSSSASSFTPLSYDLSHTLNLDEFTINKRKKETTTKRDPKKTEGLERSLVPKFTPYVAGGQPSILSLHKSLDLSKEWYLISCCNVPMIESDQFQSSIFNYGSAPAALSYISGIVYNPGVIPSRHIVIHPNPQWVFSNNKEIDPKKLPKNLVTFLLQFYNNYNNPPLFYIHFTGFIQHNDKRFGNRLSEFNQQMNELFSDPNVFIDPTRFIPSNVDQTAASTQYPNNPEKVNDDLTAYLLDQSMKSFMKKHKPAKVIYKNEAYSVDDILEKVIENSADAIGDTTDEMISDQLDKLDVDSDDEEFKSVDYDPTPKKKSPEKVNVNLTKTNVSNLDRKMNASVPEASTYKTESCPMKDSAPETSAETSDAERIKKEAQDFFSKKPSIYYTNPEIFPTYSAADTPHEIVDEYRIPLVQNDEKVTVAPRPPTYNYPPPPTTDSRYMSSNYTSPPLFAQNSLSHSGDAQQQLNTTPPDPSQLSLKDKLLSKFSLFKK